MDNWIAEIMTWLNWVDAQVGAALHSLGQDNEVVKLGVLALLGFLALAFAWITLLGLLRFLLAPFRGSDEMRPARRDLGAPGFSGPGFSGPPGPGWAVPSQTREPGRLDVIPSAKRTGSRRGRGASMASKDMAPPEADSLRQSQPAQMPQARAMSEAQPTDAPERRRPGPEGGLAQAAGGRARSAGSRIRPIGPLQHIQVRQLPRPADRGTVVSARPEWTGKVALSSLQDAGAVEVCRVLSRRVSTAPGAQTVRAVDYRVCGLPRVDDSGRRLPDALVYTVADRGFVPKGASPKTIGG